MNDKAGLRDSYFPFNHHLKDARERLAWLEFLNRHRKPLGKIKDLVLLATLWDYPDRDWTTKLYRLRLKYTGTAQSQHEALADLLRIRRALKVRTLVLKMYTPALGMPESHYHGEGKLGPVPHVQDCIARLTKSGVWRYTYYNPPWYVFTNLRGRQVTAQTRGGVRLVTPRNA